MFNHSKNWHKTSRNNQVQEAYQKIELCSPSQTEVRILAFISAALVILAFLSI